MNIAEFLERIEGVKIVSNGQWRGNCPVCNDRHGHLYISERGGKILLDCKHGCTFSEICAALDVKQSDTFPDREERVPPREHIYTDMDGNKLAKKMIWKKPNGEKITGWQRWDGDWKKGLNGLKLPLYHIAKLKDADVVYLVEGEKDVETMERLGFTATSTPNGAGSAWSARYSKPLTGKDVIIITDNDEAGGIYGQNAAKALIKVAASVKVISAGAIYPDVGEKGDISDISAKIGETKTVELLNATVENTPYYKAEDVRVTVNLDTPAYKRITTDIDPTSYEFNDSGNSKLFTDIYGGVCRWSPSIKGWAAYSNGVWQRDTGDVLARQHMEELRQALCAYSASVRDTAFVSNAAKLASTTTRDRILKDAQKNRAFKWEDLDTDNLTLNVANGTLDLNTMTLHEHTPDDMLGMKTSAAYVPGARCERWEKFIDEIMQSDTDKARYLQKALGYSLSGLIREECFFILLGTTTRNGKSTLTETIGKLMGSYAATSEPATFALKRRDASAASPDIARLKGVRFLCASEPPKGMMFNAAVLKQITGGDTIVARHLYEADVEFTPQFKLFFNTNYLPQIDDKTVFTSDRVKVIEFNRHFERHEQDKYLKETLSKPENMSGILNWLLDGYRMYRAEGLVEPQCVRTATNEYQQGQDKISRYIDEVLQINTMSSGVTGKDAYEAYRLWCKECNFSPMLKKAFYDELRKRHLLQETATVSGKTAHNVIKDHSLNEEYDPRINK